MKLNLLTSIIFSYLISNCLAHSQTIDYATIENAIEENKNSPITATLYIAEHPSKKEQFFNDWVYGSIVFENGQTTAGCMLRYNTWKDQLLWLRETDYKIGTVIKESVKSFSLNPQSPDVIHFLNYQVDQGLTKHSIYLEVLCEGKFGLYAHRNTDYNKANDSFTQKTQFYIFANNKMNKTKLNKKSVLDHFGESEQKQLKIILHENHLKIKNEYELAEALNLLSEQIGSN